MGVAVVVREIGIVTAAHVCQKGFLHDVITSIIGFLGGENKQYSDLMNEATQAAVKKLQQVASVRCGFDVCMLLGGNGLLNFGLRAGRRSDGDRANAVPDNHHDEPIHLWPPRCRPRVRHGGGLQAHDPSRARADAVRGGATSKA
jgi:uncharacterized protein YbjQ (UPF0145 family)